MGVKNFYNFIRKYAPDCIYPKNYYNLRNKRFAVDANLLLYKFLACNARKTKYEHVSDDKNFDIFFHRILLMIGTLRQFNIGLIMVFDGPTPDIKKKTVKTRKDVRYNAKQEVKKINNLIDILNKLTNMKEYTYTELFEIKMSYDELNENYENSLINDKSVEDNKLNKSLLNKLKLKIEYLEKINANQVKDLIDILDDDVVTNCKIININEFEQLHELNDNLLNELLIELFDIKDYKKKLMPKSIHLNMELQDKVKKLFDVAGIPYIESMHESDSQCACLLRDGIVDGIITDDFDVLAFGGKRIFLNVFDSSKDNSELCEINLNKLLEKLNLTYDSFVDMCILLGTDYAPSLDFRYDDIYKTISECKSIENIISSNKLKIPEDYPYVEIRKYFKSCYGKKYSIGEIEFPLIDSKRMAELQKYIKENCNLNNKTIKYSVNLHRILN